MLLIDRYKTMPKAAKAALWFTICNFFVAGLGFISGPLFTRLMSPEEYGILTLYITYEQIVLILATWEIQLGAYQRGLFRYEGNWNQFSLSTLLLINLLTIITFLLLFVFFKPLSVFTRFSASTFCFLFVYLLTNPAYTCWITRNRTTYNYRAVVGITILYSILNICIPLFAILLFGGTAAVKFNATLITSSLIFSFSYFRTFFTNNKKLRISDVLPQWKYMLLYQAPLVLHSLSYLVLGQADRIMIGKMVGEREAAYYGVAYTLASAVTILQTSLNQALTPWRYNKLKEEDYNIIGSTTNVLLILVGAAILAVVLIAPELMVFLFTDDYYEAVWCIPPVSVSIFFMFLYSTFVNVETYYEKTSYIMYVSVACGLVNIALNYYLIPIFGYIVCGYTTLFSYILFALFHYWCMKKVFNKATSRGCFFSIKRISLISIIVVVCSILFTILYPYWIARYSIFLAMIVISLFYKNKLLNTLALIKAKQ